MEETKKIKLNLACGKDYKQGFINIDRAANVKKDKQFDLETFPYPFPESHADVIIAHHIIEHLDDQQKFLEECFRILKKGGKLIIECPIGGTWSSYHINHKNNLTPWSFLIFKQKRWNWQFPFHFSIERMKVYMPMLYDNIKIPFPWRFVYINSLLNNVFTKMRVELRKR